MRKVISSPRNQSPKSLDTEVIITGSPKVDAFLDDLAHCAYDRLRQDDESSSSSRSSTASRSSQEILEFELEETELTPRARTTSLSKPSRRHATMGSGDIKIPIDCILPQIGETAHFSAESDFAKVTLDWVKEQKLFEGSSLKKFIGAQFWKLIEAYDGLPESQLKIVYKFIAWLFFHDEERDKGDTTIGKSKQKIEALNEILTPITERKLREAHVETITALATKIAGDDDNLKTSLSTLPLASITVIHDQFYSGHPILDTSELQFAIKTAVTLHHIYEELENELKGNRNKRALIEQFTIGLKAYLSANVSEADHRSKDTIPDMNGYQILRESTGAVLPCFELGLALYGILLGRDIRENAHYILIRKFANLVVSFINDPFSFVRELLAGDIHNHSIVNIAQAAKPNGSSAKLIDVYTYVIENDIGVVEKQLKDTIATVNKMVDGFCRSLADLHSEFVKSTKQKTAISLSSEFFKRWMVKNFDFSEASGRYRANFDSLIPELKKKHVVMTQELIATSIELIKSQPAPKEDPVSHDEQSDQWKEIRRNILSITKALEVCYKGIKREKIEAVYRKIEKQETLLSSPETLYQEILDALVQIPQEQIIIPT